MALIDVSDILLDPDFLSPFDLVRRSYNVNAYGESVLVVTSTVASYGSVQAPGKEAMKRIPEGVRLDSFKTIYTKAVIQADSAGNYIDQIIFQGRTYNVLTVIPWDNYGAGWYEVDVELQRKSL